MRDALPTRIGAAIHDGVDLAARRGARAIDRHGRIAAAFVQEIEPAERDTIAEVA